MAMADKVLFAWIGEKADLGSLKSDINGAMYINPEDPGPIARITPHEDYNVIHLLRDVKFNRNKECQWKKKAVDYKNTLEKQWLLNKSVIIPEDREILNPTDMDEIYQNVKSILDISNADRGESEWHFLVSSGTPSMGIVWVLLHRQYNAVLKESYNTENENDPGVKSLDIDNFYNYELIHLPGLRTFNIDRSNILSNTDNRILIAWLGKNELEDSQKKFTHKKGKIYGFLSAYTYSKVYLFTEFEQEKFNSYLDILGKKIDIKPIEVIPVTLPDKGFYSFYQCIRGRITQLGANTNIMDLLWAGMTNIQIALAIISVMHPETRLINTYLDAISNEEKAEVVFMPLVKSKHPLETMWIKTKDWFSGENNDVPHTFPTNPQGWDNFKTCLKKVWPWLNDQDQWFENEESIKNIHKAIMCFCGNNFINTTTRKSTLSLGGVFIIARMACEQLRDEGNLSDREVTDIFNKKSINWQWLDDSHYAALPWYDDLDMTKNCIKHLYNFFVKAFEKDLRNNPKGTAGITDINWRGTGREIQLNMIWNVGSLLKKLNSSWDEYNRKIDVNSSDLHPSTSINLFRFIRINREVYDDSGLGEFNKNGGVLIKGFTIRFRGMRPQR
jgi:hypothetical protein